MPGLSGPPLIDEVEQTVGENEVIPLVNYLADGSLLFGPLFHWGYCFVFWLYLVYFVGLVYMAGQQTMEYFLLIFLSGLAFSVPMCATGWRMVRGWVMKRNARRYQVAPLDFAPPPDMGPVKFKGGETSLQHANNSVEDGNVEDERKRAKKKALKTYSGANADTSWRTKNVKKMNRLGKL